MTVKELVERIATAQAMGFIKEDDTVCAMIQRGTGCDITAISTICVPTVKLKDDFEDKYLDCQICFVEGKK